MSNNAKATDVVRKEVKTEKIILGYARVSTGQQQISRQIRNIKQAFPNAFIIQDHYTGTKLDRPGFMKMMLMCEGKFLPKNKCVGTIVFDEISRMSRDEHDGYEQYKKLYNMGIELVFLKEPQLNTRTYRSAMQKCISLNIDTGDKATDDFVRAIGEALNTYTLELVDQQIKNAFAAAQKERDYLSQRTKEGMQMARLSGKRIGRGTGTKISTKKYKIAKQKILTHFRKFGGGLTAQQTADVCHISKSTFYEYLKKMCEEGIINRLDSGEYVYGQSLKADNDTLQDSI